MRFSVRETNGSARRDVDLAGEPSAPCCAMRWIDVSCLNRNATSQILVIHGGVLKCRSAPVVVTLPSRRPRTSDAITSKKEASPRSADIRLVQMLRRPQLHAAVGGLGPDQLPYGVGTVCRQPVKCPPAGSPPARLAKHMILRSNATYDPQQQNRPAGTGKAVIATNKQEGRLLVIVQRHRVKSKMRCGRGFSVLVATTRSLQTAQIQ